MISINKHIEQLKPSATLAINQKVIELREKNIEVFHFGFGQSPFPIHKSIVYSLANNADNNNYLPTIGLKSLREKIAKFLIQFHNVEAHTEDIFIGPGSKELLYQSILILEGEFLIPKGSWVSYGPQIKSKGVKYKVLETEFRDNFKLTAKTLENYCLENPNGQKTLILNSPNNPTGAVYSKEELESIAMICKKYNVIVLSDEIYSLVNFNGFSSPSIATYYPERTFVFGGLSKVFSAGGYRLGFLKIPNELSQLHKIYRSLFSETFSAVASPIQYAAVEAFSMQSDVRKYIQDGSLILSRISNFIFQQLTEVGISCTHPQGAFYLVIGFDNFKEAINDLGIHTSEALANYILDEYKVALLPASDFYFEDSELYFRVAFVDFNGKNVMEHLNNHKFNQDNSVEKYCPNIYKGVTKLIEFVEKL